MSEIVRILEGKTHGTSTKAQPDPLAASENVYPPAVAILIGSMIANPGI